MARALDVYLHNDLVGHDSSVVGFDPYRKQTLPLLARILNMDTTAILQKISQGGFYTRFQPIKVFRDATPQIIAAIEERHCVPCRSRANGFSEEGGG